MTITPTTPSSFLLLETVSRKRPRDKETGGTDDTFDLAFCDATHKGTDSSKDDGVCQELLGQLQGIESLDKRDEAFSATALSSLLPSPLNASLFVEAAPRKQPGDEELDKRNEALSPTALSLLSSLFFGPLDVPLFVKAAPHKRPKDEELVSTYNAFDLVFRDAILEGINVLNYNAVCQKLFAQAQRIESPDERDEAFSEIADYLRKTLGLESRNVQTVWLQAIERSTQSKTTFYFVNSLLEGVQAMYTQDPYPANRWIEKSVFWLQTNKRIPKERIAKFQEIIKACQKMERTDLWGTCIRAKRRAMRAIGILQNPQIMQGPFDTLKKPRQIKLPKID